MSRGTLRYRSVSSFAETVAMLLSEFIWNRQVVEEIMERRAVHQILLSCLGYICIWWLEFLKLKKKNKRLNSASYAYFNVPFPISQIIYFHHQYTGWFSHPFPMFQSYQGSIATLIFGANFLKTYTPFLFWNSTQPYIVFFVLGIVFSRTSWNATLHTLFKCIMRKSKWSSHETGGNVWEIWAC